jgi:hypothetical protein
MTIPGLCQLLKESEGSVALQGNAPVVNGQVSIGPGIPGPPISVLIAKRYCRMNLGEGDESQ